jgi:hypothetical protein
MFDAVCKLGLEGTFLTAQLGLSIRAVKDLAENQKSEIPAATRVEDGTF